MLQLSSLLISAVLCCGQPPPTGTPELSVKGAGSRGTLVVTSTGLEFQAAKADKSRRWIYAELREIRIEGPRRLVLDAYETHSRWRFGRAKRVTFAVTSGAITGDVVSAILARSSRAVMTAVQPAGLPDPTTVIPASHRRFGTATQGSLELSAAGLFYRSTPADSRYWRFGDLQSVARISPSEVLVTAYEGDRLQPYTFELKGPLPQDAFDALWQHINPPQLRSGGQR